MVVGLIFKLKNVMMNRYIVDVWLCIGLGMIFWIVVGVILNGIVSVNVFILMVVIVIFMLFEV